jgi:hypothetical protein
MRASIYVNRPDGVMDTTVYRNSPGSIKSRIGHPTDHLRIARLDVSADSWADYQFATT